MSLLSSSSCVLNQLDSYRRNPRDATARGPRVSTGGRSLGLHLGI